MGIGSNAAGFSTISLQFADVNCIRSMNMNETTV